MPSRLKQMCKANDDTRCPNLSPTCRVITSVKLRLRLHLNIHPASLCPFVPSLESSSLYPIRSHFARSNRMFLRVAWERAFPKGLIMLTLARTYLPKMGWCLLAHTCWNFYYLRVQKAQPAQPERQEEIKPNIDWHDTDSFKFLRNVASKAH